MARMTSSGMRNWRDKDPSTGMEKIEGEGLLKVVILMLPKT